MGEAKRKRKLKDQVLAHYPNCIYCGGGEPASTVDHLPPISMFELRQRPRGLEFSACGPCNSGARIDEMVASMLSRVYPDLESRAAQEEVRKLINSVNNNVPGLLEEMSPSFRQKKIHRKYAEKLDFGSGVLNCQGPILNHAIHRFAAKIGFALHFELTQKVVPAGGATSVWWFTNYQAMEGDIPQQLIDMMGNPRTLQQGQKHVGDQFQYSSIGTEDGAMTAHYATFRFSFAVCAFTAENAEMITPPDGIDHVSTHRPGWLKI